MGRRGRPRRADAMRLDELVVSARKLDIAVRMNGTLGEISINRRGAPAHLAVYAKTVEEAWALVQDLARRSTA
jgi:hypothetical protein